MVQILWFSLAPLKKISIKKIVFHLRFTYWSFKLYFCLFFQFLSKNVQSLALLCRVFSCGADVITDVASWTSPRSMYRKFMKIYKKDELYPKYGPKYLSESLFSPKPILWVSTGAPFDSYWTTNSSLRDCTFSLLSCQNEWCVHSVALSEMVKSGPLDELGAVVEDEFRGVKSETGKNKRMNHLLPPGSGLNLWFDVGIHIRTLTM